MPGFLATLLILVSTFGLRGEPVNAPPYLSDNVSEIEEKAPYLLKKVPSLTPVPSPTYIKDKLMERLDTGEVEYEDPILSTIPAYNNRSEKEMPTQLPQNAVENSPALDPVPPSSPTPTPTPTPIEEVIHEPQPPIWDPPPVIILGHSNRVVKNLQDDNQILFNVE